MDALGNALQDLQANLLRLTTRHSDLRTTMRKLEQENLHLKETLAEKDARIDELDHKVKTLQIATGNLSDDEKGVLKQKVNEYIREIDKCIAMLNA
jgi:chromosome segregation ATPase